MKAWTLCQDLKVSVPWTPLVKLGDGADGEVYSVAEDNTKVIKFGVYYEYRVPIFEQALRFKMVFDLLQKYHPQVCARVYEYKFLKSSIRDIVVNGKTEGQPYILYYYVMEKLNKLSEDEKKVFHTIVSHEDQNIVKNFEPAKLKKILAGLSRGLDFDAERVTFFHDNLRKTPFQHQDIHVRNIMKDDNGNYKLIDFDRVSLDSWE